MVSRTGSRESALSLLTACTCVSLCFCTGLCVSTPEDVLEIAWRHRRCHTSLAFL